MFPHTLYICHASQTAVCTPLKAWAQWETGLVRGGGNIGISDQREAMAMTGTDYIDFKYRFSQTAGPHMVAAGGGLLRSQDGGGSAQESWRCLWGGGPMVGPGRSAGASLQALQAAGMFAGNAMVRDGQVGQLAMHDESSDVVAPANWAYRIANKAGNGAN